MVFDALLTGDADGDDTVRRPDTGDVVADLRWVLEGSIEELTDPRRGPLLRTITAEVQHDAALAEELAERLLRPQFDAAIDRIRAGQQAGQQAGQLDPDLDPRVVMEALFGAVLHRWLLRTVPFDDDYVTRLLAVVLGPVTSP